MARSCPLSIIGFCAWPQGRAGGTGSGVNKPLRTCSQPARSADRPPRRGGRAARAVCGVFELASRSRSRRPSGHSGCSGQRRPIQLQQPKPRSPLPTRSLRLFRLVGQAGSRENLPHFLCHCGRALAPSRVCALCPPSSVPPPARTPAPGHGPARSAPQSTCGGNCSCLVRVLGGKPARRAPCLCALLPQRARRARFIVDRMWPRSARLAGSSVHLWAGALPEAHLWRTKLGRHARRTEARQAISLPVPDCACGWRSRRPRPRAVRALLCRPQA